MFQESNKIVIIDDNETDLVHLSHVFHEKGIGCKTLKYDSMYSNPLKGVRALFLDINLNSAQNDSQRNNTLKDTIVQYIHKENGPFILIFWTNNTVWVDSFIEYVNERLDPEILARNPYYISKIDKTRFYDRSKELSEKVSEIFNSNTVKTLLDFTSIMSDSVWKTMSSIIDIIPKGKKWADVELFEDNAKSVFAQIAKSVHGFENAKKDPDAAIKEAIVPVFAHNIIHYKIDVWKDFLDNLVKAKSPNDISFPMDFKVECLNSIFLIEHNIKDCTNRGAFVKINTDVFPTYFQISFNDWLKNEFGESPNLKNAYPVAVEFSAACDFSQQKKRAIRYLVGIVCDQKIKNSNNKPNLLILPNIEYNGNILYWAIDLNYSFVNLADISCLTNTLFGVKKELMDMIGNKYANHISRIGITSF